MKIFVISTGRCGTVFMSEIMRKLTPIPSFHEPTPWCVGRVCEEINNSHPSSWSQETRDELEEKRLQVEHDTLDGWYFESNQMFIKSFYKIYDPAEIGVVYLYRNPIEVAMSYAKKCRAFQPEWFLWSDWKNNELQSRERYSFYENALWQCYEIKERYLKLKPYFMKSFEIDFRNLNDPETWREFFRTFEIPHKDFTELPEAKKNAIPHDPAALLQEMADLWDVPAGSPGEDRHRLFRYVMDAKRAIAQNSARVNSCRT